MKTVTISQKVTLPGRPEAVFALLMDAKKHAAFTGGQARISQRVGGSFTTFDGWASGKNLEIVPNKKIVQTWRNQDWPEGHFSTITFVLTPKPSGTQVRFTQTDLPSAFAKDIAKGWNEYYWKPMAEALKS